MEEEISEVIRERETISTSNLEFGNIVFIKRQDVQYPQTKSQGPYIFIGYGNPDKTTATILDIKSAKLKSVNITKINPIKLY